MSTFLLGPQPHGVGPWHYVTAIAISKALYVVYIYKLSKWRNPVWCHGLRLKRGRFGLRDENSRKEYSLEKLNTNKTFILLFTVHTSRACHVYVTF